MPTSVTHTYVYVVCQEAIPQCLSILSLKDRALSVEGGRQMKSKTLIITSTVPLWSVLEKWSPTESVCFLCLMLRKVGTESLCYSIFGLTYVLCSPGFACNAVEEVRALAANVVLASVLDRRGHAFESISKWRTKDAFLELLHFLLRGLKGKVMELDLCSKRPTLVVISVRQLLLLMRHFLEEICNDTLLDALARRSPCERTRRGPVL